MRTLPSDCAVTRRSPSRLNAIMLLSPSAVKVRSGGGLAPRLLKPAAGTVHMEIVVFFASNRAAAIRRLSGANATAV